jgi:hypothetical protein
VADIPESTKMLPTDKWGENAYQRLLDHAVNGTMPPQFRKDLHDILDIVARAAPPAMDREAVACPTCGDTSPLEECATCGAYPTRTTALSTLSADAIRQGEGDIERAAKVADHYAEEAETHADMTDLGARVEMNWHVRAEALRAVAKRIRALATPASHASDGGKAVEKDVAFLREAARYFAGRPTDGEDRAHWSNVANSENCERIADRLSAWRKEA